MLLRCPSCSARYEVAAGAWPSEPAADGSLLLRPRKVRCRRCQEVWLATPEAEEEIFDPGPPIAEPETPSRTPVPAFFANRARESSPTAVISATPVRASGDSLQQLGVRADEGAEAGEEPARRRRVWLWLLAAAAAAAAGAYLTVSTDRIRPEAYGLPPLAGWARLDLSALALRQIDGQTLWLPALSLPAFSPPALSLPAITLPKAPPPRLTLATDAIIKPIPGGGIVWDVTGTISNPTRARLPIPPIELELLGKNGASLASWSVRPPAEALAPGASIAFDTSALNPPEGAIRLRVTLKPASLARL